MNTSCLTDWTYIPFQRKAMEGIFIKITTRWFLCESEYSTLCALVGSEMFLSFWWVSFLWLTPVCWLNANRTIPDNGLTLVLARTNIPMPLANRCRPGCGLEDWEDLKFLILPCSCGTGYGASFKVNIYIDLCLFIKWHCVCTWPLQSSAQFQTITYSVTYSTM